MSDYPKWIKAPEGFALIAKSFEEEAAVADGRATVAVTHSAQGDSYEVVGMKPKPPAPKGKKG